MEVSKTQKAFVILTLSVHSSSVCVGQTLSPEGITKGTTDPTLAPPIILPQTEDDVPTPAAAAAAYISNQRLPFGKALKGQSNKSPLEQQQAQGLSYPQQGNQNQPVFGLTQQPLSGSNQPFSSVNQPVLAGDQNSLLQNIPFNKGVQNQKTRTQAAALISFVSFAMLLVLHL